MAIVSTGTIGLNGISIKTAVNIHPELAEEIIDNIPINTTMTTLEPGVTLYTFDPKTATLSLKHDANANTMVFKGYDLAVRNMILNHTPLLGRIPWQDKKTTLAQLNRQSSKIPPRGDKFTANAKRPLKTQNPTQPKSTFNYDTPPTPTNTDARPCKLNTFHPASTCATITPNMNHLQALRKPNRNRSKHPANDVKNASSSSTDYHINSTPSSNAGSNDDNEVINSIPNTQILHNADRMMRHLRNILTQQTQTDPPVKYQSHIKIQNKQYHIEFS